MRRAVLVVVLFVDIAVCLLPYSAIQPARALLLRWNNWYLDTWGSFGRHEELVEGDKCDVAEEATLQWAYFRTLDVPPSASENKLYPSIAHIATHMSFYKAKMYPFLPRTSRYSFCEYVRGNKLVCDTSQKRCVNCKSVTSQSALLHEACNPKVATKEVFSTVDSRIGVSSYREIKRWVRNATQTWRKNVGDRCTANATQTLAFTTMRTFLPPGMRNGREARTKDEWVRERKWIRQEFNDELKLWEKIAATSGFQETDATYCSPLGGNGQVFDTSKRNKLVCGENGRCEMCRTKSGILRFGGSLREACQLMGVKSHFVIFNKVLIKFN